MKLALALVAALSLAACVDEPTDPAAGLYGAGIGKAFQTDPTQLVPADPVANEKFNGRDPEDFNDLVKEANRIEEFTGTDWDAVCGEPCKVIGLRMQNDDLFAYRDDGRFLGVIHADDIDATREDAKFKNVKATNINATREDAKFANVKATNINATRDDAKFTGVNATDINAKL